MIYSESHHVKIQCNFWLCSRVGHPRSLLVSLPVILYLPLDFLLLLPMTATLRKHTHYWGQKIAVQELLVLLRALSWSSDLFLTEVGPISCFVPWLCPMSSPARAWLLALFFAFLTVCEQSGSLLVESMVALSEVINMEHDQQDQNTVLWFK